MTGHLDFTEQISHLITPIVKGRRAIYLGRQRSRETEPLWRFFTFFVETLYFFLAKHILSRQQHGRLAFFLALC